ncbi:hypothetical protein ScPMuIL_012456 [Solemya velum]
MKSDVQKFCRKLCLREFFGYDTSTDNSLVRNKSNWAPNRGRDSHLDCFIDTITKFPITNSKNFKQNISKAEQRALEKLKQDETIVIKEADKGGAIVIMDKDYYREKVLDQLNDGIFYKKHSGKKTVMKKIKHLIEHHPNSVTEKEADYLCNFQIKDSNFYGLPKVHKSSEIITAVEEQKCSYIEVHRPKDLKLRPIVAGPESETQRLSHFLDLILKPICEKIPSFVRDDMDFLNHIPPEVPDSTILASFDVTSLYTNIPHDLGLTAANFWIEKHRDLVDRRFKTDFLLSALQIVLEGNTFNFDGQTYEQMKGTAMGTKVAPTYANLVMGYLEYKLYEKVKDEFDDDFKQYILGQWKRHGLGDCRRPLQDSAILVEELVHNQMVSLLYQSSEVASSRNGRFISIEDLVFLLRKDKVKLRRFLRYMELKDVKSAALRSTGMDEEDSMEQDCNLFKTYFEGEKIQPMKKRRKLCYDFLSSIDQTGELLALFDDESTDEIKHERLLRAELKSRGMDPNQYIEYCEARQVSFSRKYKSQRFKDWLMTGITLDIKPNALAMEGIAYMAYETVAQIVDLSLIVKQDKQGKWEDPLSKSNPSMCVNYYHTDSFKLGVGTRLGAASGIVSPPSTPTPQSTQSTSSLGASHSSPSHSGGSTSSGKSKSKKRKKSGHNTMMESSGLQPILPSEIKEAMRRYEDKPSVPTKDTVTLYVTNNFPF